MAPTADGYMTTAEKIRTLEWLLAESRYEHDSLHEYYDEWISDLRNEFVADHHTYTWLLAEARWYAESPPWWPEDGGTFPWEQKR